MSKNTPLVSVGIPVCNGIDVIQRCIDSIINQTYENLEIIIVDDCSSDGSFDLIKKKYSNNKKIRISKNNINIGLTENCSKIFGLSNGKYFFWSAQDDFRERTYVRKCVDLMEKNPKASLCNSNTAVFYKDPKNIMHINNLNSINNQKDIIKRYWNLSRNYNDVNIYGFMRSRFLKKTSLWLPINGSANNLLFEMIILGEFIQVSELLFFYSGKSMYERPTPEQEYNRQSSTRKYFKYPFLILLYNQLKSIINKPIKFHTKILLILIVLSDCSLVILGKFIFRFLNIFFSENKIPKIIINFCLFLSYNNKDIKYIVKPEEDKYYYPSYYPLKKII